MTRATATLRDVLAHLPAGSMRQLARAAGDSPALLGYIRAGTRAATPDVVGRVARVLEAWAVHYTAAGKDCERAARRLRRTLPKEAR